MKILIILLALSSLSKSQDLNNFKSGAAAITFAIQNGGSSLTSSQKEDFLLYTGFMRGFLHGLSTASLLTRAETKYGHPVPDAWMYEPGKSAPSFLAFIAKKQPEKFDTKTVDTDKLKLLILAWYLDSHSHKNEKTDTPLSQVLCDQVFKPKKQK